MTRQQIGRAVHGVRVQPRAAFDSVADSYRRRACARQPRGARSSVQIDRDVEALAPQPSREREIVHDSTQAAALGHDDQFVDVRVASQDRRGRGLDDVRHMRVRLKPLQRPNEGRGEDYVADQTKADEKDLHAEWSMTASP